MHCSPVGKILIGSAVEPRHGVFVVLKREPVVAPRVPSSRRLLAISSVANNTSVPAAKTIFSAGRRDRDESGEFSLEL